MNSLALLPTVPTLEMIEAGRERGHLNELEFRHRDEGAALIYKAMVAVFNINDMEEKYNEAL